MNGADSLTGTLLAHGVDVCFANPGTSEMHVVAALDRATELRCILGLFEGVVTGAADGYGRMADRPAATLLHTGPGLANGLANLHNARRARTPVLNIVGDHARHHLAHDAPLTTDIDAVAAPMSDWVGRAAGPSDIAPKIAAAWRAAMIRPGVATLIVPADCAWTDLPDVADPAPPAPIVRTEGSDAALAATVAAIGAGARVGLLLAGRALRQDALATAGRIADRTGLRLLTETFSSRIERGAGRVPTEKIPYPVDLALALLADIDVLVTVGARVPVGFFGYPGKPSRMIRDDCTVIALAEPDEDLPAALARLAEAVGAPKTLPEARRAAPLPSGAVPDGALTPQSLCAAVARLLPDGAVVVEEALTSGRVAWDATAGAAPHDVLNLTGGAIGIGHPLATGAAVAVPGRKVVCLQADGSGMYAPQALWTQARERLDVVTVIFANRTYAILQHEMRAVGVNRFGDNARRMLNLDDPAIDWVSLARGMGVEGGRAETVAGFVRLFEAALKQSGPFLIEAVL